MTSFALKIIACITMFIDHLSYAIWGKVSWMNYIGRIAFPIFAFQITEGYRHTKDIKKYFLRLFVFAIVAQIPFYIFHRLGSETFALNVLFTLFLGLLSIWLWENMPFKPLSLIIIATLCVVAEYSKMDYGYWGVLLVFVLYLCKNNKVAIGASYFLMVLIKYMPKFIQHNFYYKYELLFVGTLFAIIPILLYNEKQGRKIKYFLYIFYPAHLALLIGLYYLLH